MMKIMRVSETLLMKLLVEDSVINGARRERRRVLEKAGKGIGKFVSDLASSFKKSMDNYSKDAKRGINLKEFFLEEKQPNGYVVQGENRTITDIGSKAKNIEGVIDLSNLVSHGGGASPSKKLGEIIEKAGDVLEQMKNAQTVGEAVLQTSSDKTLEAKVNQVTQQNMGVKRFKDVKVGNVYHDARMGLNLKKDTDTTSETTRPGTPTTSGDTINKNTRY